MSRDERLDERNDSIVRLFDDIVTGVVESPVFVLKPSSNLRFELSADRNDISLVEGDFHTQIFALSADFNFSPRISWANLVQYDNESNILGLQSRFRWILKPGNDLFVVVNRGWEDIGEVGNRFRNAFDRGSVKFQYTFRL